MPLEEDFHCICPTQVSQLNKVWIAGTGYGDIYLWKQVFTASQSSGQLISVISAAHQLAVVSLKSIPNQNDILSCCQEGKIKLWNEQVSEKQSYEYIYIYIDVNISHHRRH